MFAIERHGGRARLVSDSKLTVNDFGRIAQELGIVPMRARKIGLIAARLAEEDTVVETLWNGRETRNTAHYGDWIVTNLDQRGVALRDQDGNTNTYVVEADTFADLYERMGQSNDFGEICRSRSTVLAIKFDGGFDILAPWDEGQRASSGYLLLNGKHVYGNSAEPFEATYEILPQ
jgi:hypothetical protein